MTTRSLIQAAVIALTGAAFIASAQPANAQARPRSARLAPVQSLDETRDLIKALRSIEGRTESGMNYREMGREMGDLTIAVRAFDEVLERRADTNLRQQLEEAFAPYRDAQQIWDWCVRAVECRFGFIGVNDETAGGKFLRQLVARYPSLNAQAEDGGIFSDLAGVAPQTAYQAQIVGALWNIGSGRSKALRSALQR